MVDENRREAELYCDSTQISHKSKPIFGGPALKQTFMWEMATRRVSKAGHSQLSYFQFDITWQCQGLFLTILNNAVLWSNPTTHSIVSCKLHLSVSLVSESHSCLSPSTSASNA
jgi:hypothetical protein